MADTPRRFLFNAFPANSQGGGAVIKIMKIREYLQARGHTVDLYDQWTTDIGAYDIYHHFSMFPADLPMIRFARATSVKIFIETMYWGAWQFALTAESTLPRRVLRTLRYTLRRTLPALTAEGRILRLADGVMVNSNFERDNVRRDFRISTDKIHVCANGCDLSFEQADAALFENEYGLKDFVLVTGLFEARKNQLNLIRAMKGTDIPLVLIGGAPAVHQGYYDACRAEADSNVHFIDFMDHDDPMFRSAYAACRVLALPSWHETTGKSVLEAGLLGRNVVMTTYAPAAKEYFRDLVTYVEPADVIAMREAVVNAWQSPPADALQARVQRLYTWDRVLAEREQAYLSHLDT